MNPLSQYLAEATAYLTWLTTVPHTIDHVIVVAKENEQRARRAAAQAGGGSGGGPKASGHSDPTGDRAVAGIVESSAETTRSIDAALALIGEASTELDDLHAEATGQHQWRPPVPWNRAGILALAITRLQGVDLTVITSPDLDHLVRTRLADTASWLRAKAEAILEDAPESDRSQPVQRTIVACRICGPWRSGSIAGTTGLCDQCKDFRYHHKCEPTEPIVRRWENGRGATPGMIAEAKAPKRKGRKSA